MNGGDDHRKHPERTASRRRSLRSVVLTRARRAVLLVLALLVVEYLVVPELVGASKNLNELSNANVAWLVLRVGSSFTFG